MDYKFNKPIYKNMKYTSIELFAGAGGLALGLEKAGIDHLMLNEIDEYACNTLRQNRPNWKVLCRDIAEVDFTEYQGQVDIVSGGFPCQAFSYAGKKRGLEDTRGTLFYEFARAIKAIQPKVFVAENVKGLRSHDNGRTLETILEVFRELGYKVIEPKVLKAIHYQVPQKRERLFIIGIKEEYAKGIQVKWVQPDSKIYTIQDALKKGTLYDTDVPQSEGAKYPTKKAKVLDLVPPGGYWRNLPEDIMREYMGSKFDPSKGGSTGMARRIAWDEPTLTIMCTPAQKMTERCHPDETRPFTVREYARLQTFPDDWKFIGSMSNQYKQIGNAVPVNLAYAVGRTIVQILKDIKEIDVSRNNQK